MDESHRLIQAVISLAYTFLWSACLQVGGDAQQRTTRRAKAAYDAARGCAERIGSGDPALAEELLKLERALVGWSLDEHNFYRRMSLRSGEIGRDAGHLSPRIGYKPARKTCAVLKWSDGSLSSTRWLPNDDTLIDRTIDELSPLLDGRLDHHCHIVWVNQAD